VQDEASLSGQNLVDSQLATGTKSGYDFVATPDAGPPANFYATATMTETAAFIRTGNRVFGITEDGVLKSEVSDTTPATRAYVQSSAMNVVGN
jgi:hypothetical protein